VHRIRGGDQRRDAPGCVAPVALGKVSEKGAQGSMDSFVDQLLMSAPGTLLEACREEHFEPGVREHHASHVAALGHQARLLPECALAGEERGSQRLQPGDFGGADAAGLVAYCIRYLLAREKDPVAAKVDWETRSERGKARLIVGSDVALQAGKRNEPVERAAFQVVEAEPLGDLLRDRSFSGRGRAVDRDDRRPIVNQPRAPSSPDASP
jgi:hypothetical protein